MRAQKIFGLAIYSRNVAIAVSFTKNIFLICHVIIIVSLTSYRFTKDHEWILKDSDHGTSSVAMIGITDVAEKALGDVVYVEISAIGQKVSQGSTTRCILFFLGLLPF